MIQEKSAHVGGPYPEIFVSKGSASEKFADHVRRAAAAVEFAELTPAQRKTFALQKSAGFRVAVDRFKDAHAFVRSLGRLLHISKPGLNQSSATAVSLGWFSAVGQAIFKRIPLEVRRAYMPQNDFQVWPCGDNGEDIVVKCASLEEINLEGRPSYWPAYCSPYHPTLKVKGERKIVAFAPHLIDRMGASLLWDKHAPKRFMPVWDDYYGLGDFHGFLYECVYFESVQLYDPKVQEYVPAFTMYEECVEEGWFSWRYVTKVLGSFDKCKRYYYRVGYCPAFVSGKYLVGKTLLLPGFLGTPEYQKLETCGLPMEEKKQLLEAARREPRAEELLRTGDFSLIKALHRWGVPQVVAFDHEVFKPPRLP